LKIGQCGAWNTTDVGSINIGNRICHDRASAGIVIGNFVCQLNTCNNNPPFNYSILIGQESNNFSVYSILIGSNSSNCGQAYLLGNANNNQGNFPATIIGDSNTNSGASNVYLFGHANTASAGNCNGAFGRGNTVCLNNAYVIGTGLTTEKVNTTHVDNLIAFGQGASKYHDVGNITGNVTLDWDNGNNQSVTLTGAVNLGFSDPIAGANYSITVIQGGVGSYTITWPTIKWANSIPPTLSTAVGKIDLITLQYDGANYLGAWAVNFG
jgi:hypothetical protein